MKFQISSLLLLSGMIAGGTMSLHAQDGKAPVALNSSIVVNNGKVLTSFRGQNVTVKGLEKQLTQLLNLPSGYSFTEEKTTTDQLGFTHTAYQQYFRGVIVDGGLLLVHSKAGILQSINGYVATVSDVGTNSSFDEFKAADIARTAMEITSQFRAYPSPLTIVSIDPKRNEQYALAYKVRVDGRSKNGNIVMSNVYIDANSGDVLETENLIAHQDVNAVAHTYLSGQQNIVVDSVGPHYRLFDNERHITTLNAAGSEYNQNANTGADLFPQANEYRDTSLTWSPRLALMTVRLQNVGSSSNLFTNIGWGTGAFPAGMVMSDVATNPSMAAWPDIKFNSTTLPLITRNLFIYPEAGKTYTGMFGKLNLNNGNSTDTVSFNINITGTGSFPWSDTANNNGSYITANVANPALDAHWGIERTFDYYQSVFNRTSYDNNGGPVVNYVNGIWPTSYTQNNAAAMPSPYNSMVYGMGDGVYTNPFVAIDVTGHEFTHMVVEHNGHNGLRYRGESGALNESFADIFGTCVEFYAKPATANWTIGEQVYINGDYMRSMANPKIRNNPDTYGGQYWMDPTNLNNDNGGVHYNSGLQNKWFYLLCQGGSGTNDNGYSYNVTAIGMEKAEKIAYRNLTEYMTNRADYEDAYNGSLQAVLDLYNNDTTSTEYKNVREAWYAVGLGAGGPVGIRSVDVTNSNINVFPNPASSNLNINSTLNKAVEMQVMNALGQQVRTLQVKNGSNAFDISSLPKGMYMLNFVVDGKSYTHKVSVQ
jgi:Zn-dependent metalloprotease